MVYLFVGRLLLDYVAIVLFPSSLTCSIQHADLNIAGFPHGQHSNFCNNAAGLFESSI